MKTIRLPEQIIDSHCHGRDMEQWRKTTLTQVIKEAKASGISISIFMPNTDPPLDNFETLYLYLARIREAAEKAGLGRQYVYFGVTDGNIDQLLTERALAEPEVVGFKIYPKKPDGGLVTTGSIGVSQEETILKAMALAIKYDKAIAVHCDDPEIIAQEGNTVRAECSYVEKIIRLAGEIEGVKVVICHVSCRESAELILAAQENGINIAIELAPHYLWFDDTEHNWNLTLDPIFYHCFNKIRGKRDRIYLAYLLIRENPLIFIGSDSACHGENEKLEKKLGGIPSNQEMVAVIVTLAARLGIPESRVANLLSFNAARFFNIKVSERLVECGLEKRFDNLIYNRGLVVNPWQGSKLLFPTKTEKTR